MRRSHLLLAARAGFVALVLISAWWGFRGRWDEVLSALEHTGPLRLASAVVLALVGLSLTGVLWRSVLAALGSPVSPQAGAEVFFVGQLGKYVPGSVWSFAVQAQLGRRHGVPPRSSVSASALFLLLHTFTGLVLGGLLVAFGAVEMGLPTWAGALVAVGGCVAMAPPALRWLGGRIAGEGVEASVAPGDVVRAAILMVLVWSAYGASLWAVVPPAAESVPLLTAVAAFALAHGAGVLLVLAPAGVGAREAVVIAVLAPAVGVPAAGAAALLSRVAHALADLLIAAGAHLWGRAPIRASEVSRAGQG